MLYLKHLLMLLGIVFKTALFLWATLIAVIFGIMMLPLFLIPTVREYYNDRLSLSLKERDY